MDSRVGVVQIRLRVPEELADRVDALRRSVERDVVVRVLEELERRVHAQHGATAVLRIRSVSLRWQLDLASLASDAIVARLADDLAAHLAAEVAALDGPARLRPHGAELALFADAAHVAAALIADAVDGEAAHWIHAGRSAPQAWRATIGHGPDEVHAVLAWLARMDRIEPALAALSVELAAALRATLPVTAWPEAARRSATRAEGERPASPAGPAGPTSGPASAVAGAAGPPAAPGPVRVSVVAAASSDPGSRVGPGPAHEPARPAEPGVPRASVADRVAGHVEVRATSAAGVFYLVAGALEIGLAERLWAAGLPEGDVLAHVAAAIAGGDPDPAWRWFGGVFSDRDPAAPPVAAWAIAEVREQTMHALGLRLVRFGVETTPGELDTALARLATGFPPRSALEPGLGELVGRSAAALAMLAAARLGEPADPGLLRGVCARPGRMQLAADRLTVVLAAGDVDLAVRRAGLDRDPGHVPWMGRALEFVFEGLEVE